MTVRSCCRPIKVREWCEVPAEVGRVHQALLTMVTKCRGLCGLVGVGYRLRAAAGLVISARPSFQRRPPPPPSLDSCSLSFGILLHLDRPTDLLLLILFLFSILCIALRAGHRSICSNHVWNLCLPPVSSSADSPCMLSKVPVGGAEADPATPRHGRHRAEPD